VNNVITHNKATSVGGGIHIGRDSSGNVINNTLAHNDLGEGGEGISMRDIASVRIANNIIAWHTYGLAARGTGLPDNDYNDIWASSVANYDGLSPGPHDVSVAPLFVAPSQDDYHLASDSPIIDAGTSLGAPQDDFEGDPRPWDGNGDGDPEIDIGADEFRIKPSYRVYLPIALR
jgi:hypothetical protein